MVLINVVLAFLGLVIQTVLSMFVSEMWKNRTWKGIRERTPQLGLLSATVLIGTSVLICVQMLVPESRWPCVVNMVAVEAIVAFTGVAILFKYSKLWHLLALGRASHKAKQGVVASGESSKEFRKLVSIAKQFSGQAARKWIALACFIGIIHMAMLLLSQPQEYGIGVYRCYALKPVLLWQILIAPYLCIILWLACKLHSEPADELYFGQEMKYTSMSAVLLFPYYIVMFLMTYTSVLNNWVEPFHLDFYLVFGLSAFTATQVIFPLVAARKIRDHGCRYIGGSVALGHRVAVLRAVEEQAEADAIQEQHRYFRGGDRGATGRAGGDTTQGAASSIVGAAAAGAAVVDCSSMDSVLAHPVARGYLRQFMYRTFTSESILFWEAVSRLHASTAAAPASAPRLSSECQRIYSMFVSAESDLMVNLSSAISAELTACVQQGKCDAAMFDRALSEVVAMIRVDSFPRFLASAEHAEMREELEALGAVVLVVIIPDQGHEGRRLQEQQREQSEAPRSQEQDLQAVGAGQHRGGVGAAGSSSGSVEMQCFSYTREFPQAQFMKAGNSKC